MNTLLRFLFYSVIVKFVMSIVLGMNVRNRDKLPLDGPAIIVANHNSHLDTMALMTLMSKNGLPVPKPIAAADYFLRNPLIKWFALKIVGILPISRKNNEIDPLIPVYDALEKNEVLLFFPEGSRGEPEQMGELKGGIAKLAERYQDIPIVPVYMHGLGKALPKGEALLVPFFCDVFVGDALYWNGDRQNFLQSLKDQFLELGSFIEQSEW